MKHSTKQISVIGQASGKTVKVLSISERDTSQSLMNFLLEHGITIASSCKGEGSCKKCVINDNILSCQVSIKEFLGNSAAREVKVTYL